MNHEVTKFICDFFNEYEKHTITAYIYNKETDQVVEWVLNPTNRRIEVDNTSISIICDTSEEYISINIPYEDVDLHYMGTSKNKKDINIILRSGKERLCFGVEF